VTLLGPAEELREATKLAQSFNAVAQVVTPFIGAAFILSVSSIRVRSDSHDAHRDGCVTHGRVSTVRTPYLVIAGLFLAYAVVIFVSRLPEVGATDATVKPESQPGRAARYLALQPSCKRSDCTVFLRGGSNRRGQFRHSLGRQHSIPGMLQKDAAFYLKLHLIGFMIGRFSVPNIMKRVLPPGCFIVWQFRLDLSPRGSSRLWRGRPLAVVLIGFFHSIMFPTIFALSVKQLGRYTKLGSSLLVASIIGGAIFPAIMGFISTTARFEVAFIVPQICQAYVLYFAVRGYRLF